MESPGVRDGVRRNVKQHRTNSVALQIPAYHSLQSAGIPSEPNEVIGVSE